MRVAVASAALWLSACATTSMQTAEQWAPWPGTSTDDWRPFPKSSAPVASASPRGLSVAALLSARAGELVGQSLRALTPHLPDDCTGLARAVYEPLGVELMQAAQRGDSGVSAMYRLASELGALHRGRPSAGDLIFFVETYDRNRDGRRNDGLTHVAVVESVDAAGTVTFVHRGGSGVTRSHLNLAAPAARSSRAGAVLNDWLRPKSKLTRAYFTGELFAGYAAGALLVKAAAATPRQARAAAPARRR